MSTGNTTHTPEPGNPEILEIEQQKKNFLQTRDDLQEELKNYLMKKQTYGLMWKTTANRNLQQTSNDWKHVRVSKNEQVLFTISLTPLPSIPTLYWINYLKLYHWIIYRSEISDTQLSLFFSIPINIYSIHHRTLLINWSSDYCGNYDTPFDIYFLELIFLWYDKHASNDS